MIKTFIKDLPGIEKVRPECAEKYESHLFEWPKSLIPYYTEWVRRKGDIFILKIREKMGEDGTERYEYECHHYCFKITPMWGRTLTLDGSAGYTEMDFHMTFWQKHAEFHTSESANISDYFFFNWHFHRYRKKEEKYKIVQIRLIDYFRELTRDQNVILDVGRTSTFIYFDPKIKNTIESLPSIYY